MDRKLLSRSIFVIVTPALLTGCLCGPCEEATKNKELALASFEVLRSGELDSLDELLAADYVRHCQATPDVEVTSLEAFKEYLRREAETFSNPEITVNHLLSEDNLVAFWATYAGDQEGPMGPYPATGKRMEIDFAGVHRIEDGKIAETWVTWDNMVGLTQLGLFPPQPPETLE
jgi:steroid delta-isomerase-like uncharacterized protein